MIEVAFDVEDLGAAVRYPDFGPAQEGLQLAVPSGAQAVWLVSGEDQLPISDDSLGRTSAAAFHARVLLLSAAFVGQQGVEVHVEGRLTPLQLPLGRCCPADLFQSLLHGRSGDRLEPWLSFGNVVLGRVRLCSKRWLLHEPYRWHLTLGLQLLLVLRHSFVIHEIWLDMLESSDI